MAAETMGTPPRPQITGLREGLVRRRDERVVAGVCAGVARWLGVDPIVVRLATCVLALANGVGLVVYLAAWAVLPDEPVGLDTPARSQAGPAAAAPGRGRVGGRRSTELALAVGCLTLGALLLVKWVAPVFPDQLVWPAAVAATGIGLVLARAGDSDRARWREAAARLPGNPVESFRGGWVVWVRVLFGAQLLIVGIGLFLATNGALSSLGEVGVAVLATVLGGALLFGPWGRPPRAPARRRAARAHPQRRARRHGRPPARLGPADAGAHPAPRRRPAAGAQPGAPAGA